MATGACGINCDVCRLNLLGVCSTCGDGTSQEARAKMSAQERLLGSTCAILSCCAMNRNHYCPRDCAQFPCDNFTRSSYPFGPAFLAMQARRRKDWLPRHDPLGRIIQAPDDLWDRLEKKDIPQLLALTLIQTQAPGMLTFPFLDLNLAVDIQARQIFSLADDQSPDLLDLPLLTLLILSYLTRVDRFFPMGKDLISTQDMDRGNYFTGPQQLPTAPVLKRFAQDRQGLARAAQSLGGISLDFTEDAFALHPFPRLALYYLFRDLESSPRLSILFDRPIQTIFTAPMVWELVNVVNARLICA